MTPSREAVDYALRQLAVRAGVAAGAASSGTGFESLGLEVCYGDPPAEPPTRPTLVIRPAGAAAVAALEARGGPALTTVGGLPILLWGQGAAPAGPFASLAGQLLTVHADLVAATLFMLTRSEERRVQQQDRLGRAPASLMAAARHGFLDRPVIDEYGLELATWLGRLLSGWTPVPRRFRVQLSHDIDTAVRFATPVRALRALAGAILKDRSPRHAVGTVRDALVDPFLAGTRKLARLSKAHRLDSTFFFMAARPGPYDSGYDPELPKIRASIEALRGAGFRIGLHGGFDSAEDPAQLATEQARLARVLGDDDFGIRQHCLRFVPPATWRHQASLGFRYDATLGYADQEGFRCGTCQPFRPFDLEHNRELAITEEPLIVMDGTLRDYRQLTVAQGEARILELAARCQRVGGNFTLLWHNSSLRGDWRDWGRMYARVLGKLAALT